MVLNWWRPASPELSRDLDDNGGCQPAPHAEGVRARGETNAGDDPDVPAAEGLPYSHRSSERFDGRRFCLAVTRFTLV